MIMTSNQHPIGKGKGKMQGWIQPRFDLILKGAAKLTDYRRRRRKRKRKWERERGRRDGKVGREKEEERGVSIGWIDERWDGVKGTWRRSRSQEKVI